MTAPNEELISMLRAKGCPDWVTARWLMESAADLLQSQAEHIKELELLVKVKNKPICDYQELIAERDTLRAELATIAATEPSMIYHGRCVIDCGDSGHQDVTMLKMIARETKLFTRPMPAKPQDHEIRELVDRLTAIAKEYGQTQQLRERIAQEIRPFTFTKPAQDVTELVEALEKLARLGNGEHYGNSDGNMIARDALSKYKGAK